MEQFQFTEQEKKIFYKLAETSRELGFPTYIIGGYVRDRLLGRATKDIDVVCIGSGIQLAEAYASKLKPRPKVAVFARFGTAMLKHEGVEIEFVGARKESYDENSRKPTVENGTLEDDQNRRDFTINALAISLNEKDYGRILDPFGGLAHLKEGLLKTPLNPIVTFSDDPLRMMRAIRFSTQLGFPIEKNTFDAIKTTAERIKIISQERITTEMEKIMSTPVPSVGYKLLFESGLLKLIFPEMVALHGTEDYQGKGHKDNFYHTLQVLDNLCQKSQNIWLRWAAVFHDIAKPATKRYEPGHGWTFHSHEIVGSKWVPKIFTRMKLPLGIEMRFVQKMVLLHQRPIALTKEDISDSAVRRLLFDAGEDIDELMTLCRADITSRNEDKVKKYLRNYDNLVQKMKTVEEKDRLRNWQPPVDGQVIMDTFGIGPSKEVGIIKNTIRDAILDGDISNDYEQAFQLMLNKGQKLGLKRMTGND
jgi:poly(A) polymerase